MSKSFKSYQAHSIDIAMAYNAAGNNLECREAFMVAAVVQETLYPTRPLMRARPNLDILAQKGNSGFHHAVAQILRDMSLTADFFYQVNIQEDSHTRQDALDFEKIKLFLKERAALVEKGEVEEVVAYESMSPSQLSTFVYNHPVADQIKIAI